MKIRYTVTMPSGDWTVVEGGAALDALMADLAGTPTRWTGVTIEATSATIVPVRWFDQKLRET